MGKPSDSLQSDRYRSWAHNHVHSHSNYTEAYSAANTIPSYRDPANTHTETGGLNEKTGGHGSPTIDPQSESNQGTRSISGALGGPRSHGGNTETLTGDDGEDAISSDRSPPSASEVKSEDAGTGDSPIEPADGDGKKKPPIRQRMVAGLLRSFVHLKKALFHSWVNVLLIFVPIGIIARGVGLSAGIIFGMNAIAIIPLAGMLAFATEAVAVRLGDTLGALLNVSFGNAVELIIFIIALVKNEIAIVQASLLGSILSNLLLILGMAFLLGGLRYREQIYNSTVTQMSACLLSLSVVSLLLPTAFYASFKTARADLADSQVLKVSRGTSVVLLLIYILYLLFQLKSHAYMYESTPQAVIDEESHPGVLADMLNSSSSSDDSDSTDDTDSDTSGSGSVAAAGKRIKRVFRNRRRRKSSASSSVTHSALSSPSTLEQQGNYFESTIGSQHVSRRPSQLVGLPDNADAEADHEDNSEHRPRIKDFGGGNSKSEASSKSPDRKKFRKIKRSKKHHKKRHNRGVEEDAMPANNNDNILTGQIVQTPIQEEPKTVGFADKNEMIESPTNTTAQGGSSFNMRQLSSRVRPGLPSLLSNNVFVTPPPAPTPQPRLLGPVRSHSRGTNLRRTSSLPDRLNREVSNPATRAPMHPRTDPLPPFQHQRFQRPRQVINSVKEAAIETAGLDSDDDTEYRMSRTSAVVLLLCSTVLVAVCAEFMVDAIPEMLASSPGISQAFVGLIILPIVSNAAEHVTAVTVAAKNKMDLAIGVAVGSSIQIALFVTPIVVLLGWIIGRDMSLYFNLFETISLFVTAFVVNFLVLDGRSNYLEGSLLIAAYVIIALGAFFYPSAQNQSQVGGGA